MWSYYWKSKGIGKKILELRVGKMNKENPLISIVITTFERTDRLKLAIESAINQTYINKEILVVDDNPSNSYYRKEVEKVMSNYPDVIYIKNSVNVGGALARNIGIDHSKGEFIAFLDDDDTFRKTKLELQYSYYKEKNNENIGLIYCYSSEIDDKGNEIGLFKENYENKPIYKQMLGCIAGTSLWFAPKKVLLDVGKFEDTPNKQDSILLLKILVKGYEVYRVPEVLVNYTEHQDGRISGIKAINSVGTNKYRNLCRENYSYLDRYQVQQVEYNFSKHLIPLYLKGNYRKKAFEELKIMIRNYPLKKDTIVSIVKCFFPRLYLDRLKTKTHKE